MEVAIDILLDAVLDCLKLLPFLFLTIFLMEYIEHRAEEKFIHTIQNSGKFGPLIGAALGIVPQCGFSAACAELFNGGLVTAGTLVAVFLSTSDEAVPILLADPSGWRDVLRLILVKFLIAVVAGFVLDAVWSIGRQQREYVEHSEPHVCESDEKIGNILKAAAKRTLEILLYLFLFTLGIAVLIHFIGEDRLAALMLPGPFQPLIAAVIGLIPNCAASVLLTRLYLQGMISFGAAVAGLCSAAGIGMLVLLKGKRKPGIYAIVIGVTFGVAVVSGMLLQLIG